MVSGKGGICGGNRVDKLLTELLNGFGDFEGCSSYQCNSRVDLEAN